MWSKKFYLYLYSSYYSFLVLMHSLLLVLVTGIWLSIAIVELTLSTSILISHAISSELVFLVSSSFSSLIVGSDLIFCIKVDGYLEVTSILSDGLIPTVLQKKLYASTWYLKKLDALWY